jgi:hypothetical protein
MGPLYINAGQWTLIAPTETGPQAYNPGGEIAMWRSDDRGMTWRKARQLTHDSPRNHTYVRRPLNAHSEFYGFWADGNARSPSLSRLYFTDKAGERVRRLPIDMTEDFQAPEDVR